MNKTTNYIYQERASYCCYTVITRPPTWGKLEGRGDRDGDPNPPNQVREWSMTKDIEQQSEK